jgi:hypothetical protein
VLDKQEIKANRKISAVVSIGMFLLAVNVVMIIVKLCLDSATGSMALRADGIHSLIDVFASLMLLIGFFLLQRKSWNFPCGLYKIENVAVAVISREQIKDTGRGLCSLGPAVVCALPGSSAWTGYHPAYSTTGKSNC